MGIAMQQIKQPSALLPKLLGCVLIVAMGGCATPPAAETPSGTSREPANSEQAVKEYLATQAVSKAETTKLENENAQLRVIVAALAKQADDLKTFIATTVVTKQLNEPKGRQEGDTSKGTLGAISLVGSARPQGSPGSSPPLPVLVPKEAPNATVKATPLGGVSQANTSAKGAPVNSFVVLLEDRSLTKLLVRWANQAGYSVVLNGALVDSNRWPLHKTKYIDPVLDSRARNVRVEAPFKDALGTLSRLYLNGQLGNSFIVQLDTEKQVLTINTGD